MGAGELEAWGLGEVASDVVLRRVSIGSEEALGDLLDRAFKLDLTFLGGGSDDADGSRERFCLGGPAIVSLSYVY